MPRHKIIKCQYCNKPVSYENSYKTSFYNKYFRYYCCKEHQNYIEKFKRYWCVYVHVNKINNKKYIGITKAKKADNRWGYEGKGYKKYQPVFYRAIQKYGWDNFEHKILFRNLTQQEAKSKEKFLIKYYNTCVNFKNNNGYNITLGGDEHSIGQNKKLSEKYKGKNNPMYGKNYEDFMTEDAIIARRKKVSKALKGRVFSKEHNLKLSQSKLGIKQSEETKNRRRESMNKFYQNNLTNLCRKGYKRVICDGVIYNSISFCAKHYNISPDKMRKWLSKNKIPQEFLDKGLSYYGKNNE